MFRAYDLNHSCEDCDVFVSIAKLKEHAAAGRSTFGNRQPSKSALPENDPQSPPDGGHRVPRVVADLVTARPVHIAIIDGIESMAGGEGPWVSGARHVAPGVLIAGTNPVSTNAVGMAVMGLDPMADRGSV